MGQARAKASTAADPLQQHYEAARAYGLAGNRQKSVEEFREFLAAALGRLANAKTRAGDLAAAEGLLSEALDFAPRNADLLADRVALFLLQGKFDDARHAGEEALKVLPGNLKIEALMGRVLFEKGDFSDAKSYLEKDIVAKPTVETGFKLGVTYLKLKDVKHARMLFDEMTKGLGDSVQLRIMFGRAYRQAAYWDESIEELKQATAKYPKARQAHYFLGLAYLGRDNDSGLPEAMPEFRAELELNPDDYRSRYMLGYGLLKQHDSAGAEKELTQAAKLDPENPDPWIYLAQIYFETDRKGDAETAARKAIVLTTDSSHADYQVSRAHYLLARTLLEQGKREEGSAELAKSEQLRKERMQKLEAAREPVNDSANTAQQVGREETGPSRVSPEDKAKALAYIEQLKPAVADAYNNLGVAAAGKKEFSRALSFFERAAEWNPSLEQLDRNLGMAAFYGGAADKAIPPLWRELQKHPEDVRVRAALGLSYFNQENYATTMQILEPIQAQVDSDPGLSTAFAVSQTKTGQIDAGMARLKQLAAANPGAPDIHVFLGNGYAEQRIYAPAIEEYRKAIALDASQPRNHYLLGVALIKQGLYAEAIPEMRNVLKLDPSDVSAKYHLAFSLIQTGEKAEARTLLQQVLEQDNTYADAHYQMGKLQLDQGDIKASIASLENAARLSPGSDYIHYQLAQAYRRDARTEDAEREMKEFQALKDQRRGGHEQPQSN